MIFMGKEPISGPIREFTRGNGRRIKCMEKDKSYGKMEENIQE